MNATSKLVGGIGAALVLAGGVYVAMNQPPPAGETQPVIAFSQAPYAHNMQYLATAPSQITYSGRYMVHSQQWGAFVLDLDKAANGFKMISPVGKIDPMFQSPVYPIWGDCWQSGVGVAATPFSPKWVVVWGTPKMCSKRCGNVRCEPRLFPEMIQVMRLDPPGFRFVGAVHAPKVPTLSDVILDGDFAYAKEQVPGIPPVKKWTTIDLNTLTVVAEGLLSAPERVLQTSVDGFTYSIRGVLPNPVPQPWPGYKNFQAVRSDTIIPTVPAPPTGTPAPQGATATKTKSPTARPGPVPCDTIPGGPICTPVPGGVRTATRSPLPQVTIPRTPVPGVTSGPCPPMLPNCKTPIPATATETAVPAATKTTIPTLPPVTAAPPAKTPTKSIPIGPAGCFSKKN